jgi:hypothetical protein
MHTLTVQTRFTFGDRVRFESATQGRSGVGTVFAITIDRYGHFDYMLEIDGDESGALQPGILEGEMTLLDAGAKGS